MILLIVHVVFVLASSDRLVAQPSTGLSLQGYVLVPLRFGEGTSSNPITSPFVHGTIGGTKVTLLVDTGATNCYLDLALTKQLGLKLRPTAGTVNVDGVKHPTQATDVTDFRLGDVIRRGSTRFDVYDMTASIAHSKETYGVEFHGIIGTNFLEGYSAIIDYRNKALHLNDPSAWDLKLMQGSWKGVGCEWLGDVITDKEYVGQAMFKVNGEEFEFEHNGVIYTGTLQLDGINTPKRYVVSDLKKNGKPVPAGLLGLYEVDKTRLGLMIPVKEPAPQRLEDLPVSFKTSPENGMAVFAFSRLPASTPQCPPPRPSSPDK